MSSFLLHIPLYATNVFLGAISELNAIYLILSKHILYIYHITSHNYRGLSPQPHGISPAENVVKECGEEAGIPAALAGAAR